MCLEARRRGQMYMSHEYNYTVMNLSILGVTVTQIYESRFMCLEASHRRQMYVSHETKPI